MNFFKSSGKKTFITGIGLIILGLIELILLALGSELVESNVSNSFQKILEGFGLIGLRAAYKAQEPKAKKVRVKNGDSGHQK